MTHDKIALIKSGLAAIAVRGSLASNQVLADLTWTVDEIERLRQENQRLKARIHWAGDHPLALPPSEDDGPDGLDRLVGAMHLRDEEIEQLRQANARLRVQFSERCRHIEWLQSENERLWRENERRTG